MSIRVQKTFEALFALEDLREIFRGSLPTSLGEEEEKAFRAKIADLKSIIAEARRRPGCSRTTMIADTIPLRSREEEYINIQPIQAAGQLTRRRERP